MPDEQMTPASFAGCGCRVCMLKRSDERLPSANIHSYHAPRAWSVKRTTDPEDIAAPTFGVELEVCCRRVRYTDLPGAPVRPGWLDYTATEAERQDHAARLARFQREMPDYDRRNGAHRARQARAAKLDGDLTPEETAGLAAPRGLWRGEHDGSLVNGVELVSQPATLRWWTAARPAITGMLSQMLHGGVRSHDSGCTGLHIHVGHRSFADAEHLYRFVSMFYANPRATTRLSQRTHDSVSHWARLDGSLADATSRRRACVEAMAHGVAYSDRYQAVNLTHDHTAEVRVLRGTVRPDRFFAKLQMTAALVEWTRDATNPLRLTEWMTWLQGRPEYADAAAFVAERFPARLERAA